MKNELPKGCAVCMRRRRKGFNTDSEDERPRKIKMTQVRDKVCSVPCLISGPFD